MGYDCNLQISEALKQYYLNTGFSEKQYEDRWVKVELGPIPIVFPNTKSRRKAVKIHDIHHILTEYGTDWIGEAEIGAWELGSGCKDIYVAWILNIMAVGVGIFIDRNRVIRAFLRGRGTKNLFDSDPSKLPLLKTIRELRQELFLNLR